MVDGGFWVWVGWLDVWMFNLGGWVVIGWLILGGLVDVLCFRRC